MEKRIWVAKIVLKKVQIRIAEKEVTEKLVNFNEVTKEMALAETVEADYEKEIN